MSAQRPALPLRDAVKPNIPLRLSGAAAIAFPDGWMTASGLRRERRGEGRSLPRLLWGSAETKLRFSAWPRRMSAELAVAYEP